jgi:hypothetical protein
MVLNFTERDVTRLLDCVERVLPLGGNDWENVAAFYNHDRPARVVDRLDLGSLDSIGIKNH